MIKFDSDRENAINQHMTDSFNELAELISTLKSSANARLDNYFAGEAKEVYYSKFNSSLNSMDTILANVKSTFDRIFGEYCNDMYAMDAGNAAAAEGFSGGNTNIG